MSSVSIFDIAIFSINIRD